MRLTLLLQLLLQATSSVQRLRTVAPQQRCLLFVVLLLPLCSCSTTDSQYKVKNAATSCAAGNFFSAAFEDRCAAVAGASGGIFGLLGLFIADMVLNFETLTRCTSTLNP